MIKEPKKDKMIREGETSTKRTGAEIEFFFSGSTEYLPQTIKAISRGEAEKIWLQTRIKKVEKQTKI